MREVMPVRVLLSLLAILMVACGASMVACGAPVAVEVVRVADDNAEADDNADDGAGEGEADDTVGEGDGEGEGEGVAAGEGEGVAAGEGEGEGEGEGDADEAVLVGLGVPAAVAASASRAWQAAGAAGLSESPVFTVIDFSQPSTAQRLWTVDMVSGALLFRGRVSHGSGSNSPSDPAMASSFSNTSGSLQTSLGLSRTAETYDGSNGYSLRLDGLEDENDAMRDRAIVMHGAAYAEDEFVDDNGYLGRSSGCPAVAMSRSEELIDLVKEGSLLFSWFPDERWLASSPFLN